MSRFFSALTVSLVLSQAALASGPRQVLTCGGTEEGNIESITGYSNNNDGDVDEMSVTLKTGEVKCYKVAPTSIYIEASFALPSDANNNARILQWRHTGWTVTTYVDGFGNREGVDCE